MTQLGQLVAEKADHEARCNYSLGQDYRHGYSVAILAI